MDARRKRWYAALMIFVLWVAALGAMAVVSGAPPPITLVSGTTHPWPLAADGSGRTK